MNAAPPSPLDAPVDELLGRTIADGRYRLESVIGAGAFGVVYRARHLALDRDVAVKILHTDLVHSHPSVAERFKREAQASSMLRHRNTVQVLDFGDDGGRLFLVMEYIEGRSLFELAHTESLTIAEIADIMAQVLAGLAAAHDIDIIHRDVKPENVLVELDTRDDGTTGHRARVCDFGLAKLQTRDKEPGRATLTARGEIFGTPEFMSPEQARGEPLDARSDIYACGVMLYQLTCGRVPFDAETPVGILMRHITDVPEPPRELSPDLPEALEAIILKALAKSPDDRFPSAREMRNGLVALGHGDADAWLSGLHPMPVLDEATRRTAPQPSPAVGLVFDESEARPRGRAPMLVVALAVVAVVAAIAVALTSQPDTPDAPVAAATPPAPQQTAPPPTAAVTDGATEIPGDQLAALPSTPPAAVMATVDVVSGLTRSVVGGLVAPAPPATRPPPATVETTDDEPSPARPRRDDDRRVARDEPTPAETTPAEPTPPPADVVAEPEPTPTEPAPSEPVAVTALVEPAPAPEPPAPAPSLEASVSIGSVNTKGSLPRTSVARALDGSVADLESCYRRAARAADRDEAADLAVAFEVDVDGWVRSVRVGQGGLPGLRSCVADVVGQVRTRERPDTGTVLAGAKIRFSPR